MGEIEKLGEVKKVSKFLLKQITIYFMKNSKRHKNEYSEF